VSPPRRFAAAAALLAVGVTAVSCLFGVDPDRSRFSCVETKDCGPDFECRPQASGGALCFRVGECADEVCDEQDNNCDGLVDESFDLAADPAHCGTCANACLDGAGCAQGRCRESRCDDGQDNDQDGLQDCSDKDCPLGGGCFEDAGLNCGRQPVDGGEPDAGEADAGEADAGEPDAGVPLERACVPREADCENGADDDLDGHPDCEDLDCDGRTCANRKTCSGGECR